MRSFEIARSSTDTLTSHSGLALVGRGIPRTSLARDLDTMALRHGIAHSDCVISYIGLLATGKSDFDAIESRRDDAFLRRVFAGPHGLLGHYRQPLPEPRYSANR